jgi:hypothetical protein
MINKTYKRIINKYSIFFKFIFFLRYLFGIFLISIVLFLIIPHFSDLKKKEFVIKNHLKKKYSLKLDSYENIKYNLLPTPNLIIQNADVSIEGSTVLMDVANLAIYPKLLSLYNYADFETNKIVLNKNNILLSVSDLKVFINYIHSLKNKIIFKNLNLKLNSNKLSLINLKNIDFSNHGYNKNIIKGQLFDKNFEILLNDNYNKIDFELFQTGITININLNEIKNKSLISGNFKSTFLNSKLKFDFDYDEEKLQIYNSYFRNKNLVFNNSSKIMLEPFFSILSVFKVEDINTELFKNINLNKIFASKDLIRKLNTKNKVNFKSKNFSSNLIDDLNLDINLAYGRLDMFKKILISENIFTCQSDINLLEEFPILYFNCLIDSKDKKKFLKEFSINYKNKNELFNLNVEGYINILNKKIKFKKIKLNQNYIASKEDLNFLKQSFENILLDKGFFSIFNFKKIKDFILYVS